MLVGSENGRLAGAFVRYSQPGSDYSAIFSISNERHIFLHFKRTSNALRRRFKRTRAINMPWLSLMRWLGHRQVYIREIPEKGSQMFESQSFESILLNAEHSTDAISDVLEIPRGYVVCCAVCSSPILDCTAVLDEGTACHVACAQPEFEHLVRDAEAFARENCRISRMPERERDSVSADELEEHLLEDCSNYRELINGLDRDSLQGQTFAQAVRFRMATLIEAAIANRKVPPPKTYLRLVQADQ
jgi:hypothetical protein